MSFLTVPIRCWLLILALLGSLDLRAEDSDVDPTLVARVTAFNETYGCSLEADRVGPVEVWSSAGRQDARACAQLVLEEIRTLQVLLGDDVAWPGELRCKLILLGGNDTFLALTDDLEKSGHLDVIRADLVRKCAAFNVGGKKYPEVISRAGRWYDRRGTHQFVANSIIGSLIVNCPISGKKEKAIPAWIRRGLSSMVNMRHAGRLCNHTLTYKNESDDGMALELKSCLRGWCNLRRAKRLPSLHEVTQTTAAGLDTKHIASGWLALEVLWSEWDGKGASPLRQLLEASVRKRDVRKIFETAMGRDYDAHEAAMAQWAGKALLSRSLFKGHPAFKKSEGDQGKN